MEEGNNKEEEEKTWCELGEAQALAQEVGSAGCFSFPSVSRGTDSGGGGGGSGSPLRLPHDGHCGILNLLLLSLFLSFFLSPFAPSALHVTAAAHLKAPLNSLPYETNVGTTTKQKTPAFDIIEKRQDILLPSCLPACFYTQTADTDTTTKGACAPPLEWSDFPSCVIQTTRPPSVLMLLLFFFAKEINASLPFQTYVCTINEYFLASIIIFSFFFASLLLLQLDGDDCACVFVGPYSIRFGKRCERRHTTKHSKSSAR